MASLVYSHIWVYRLTMNVLYAGGYRQRLRNVVDLVGDGAGSVCDLCFGDTIVADWCASRGIRWTGVDCNAGFCDRARRKGYEVLEGDVLSVELPQADVFVMAGSLYHFHDRLPQLFDAVWPRTRRWIVSEPVRNLSSRRDIVGRVARRVANPGGYRASFRYTETSLADGIRAEQQRLGFESRVVSVDRDLVVVMDRSR